MTIDPKKIKGICLEGGSMLAFGHMGALSELKKKGVLSQINYFSGASAGGLIAGMLSIKAPLDFIQSAVGVCISFMEDSDFSRIQNLKRFWKKGGLFSGNELEKIFGKLIESITGNRDVTLKEIYDKHGNYLSMSVVDCYKLKCEILYVDHINYPDMPLKRAMRLTSGMQWWFKSLDYKSDGGLLNNLPVKPLLTYIKIDELICLKFVKNPIQVSLKERPENAIDYTKSYLTSVLDQARRVHISKDMWARCIKINECIGTLDFTASNDEKMHQYREGRQAVRKVFSIPDVDGLDDDDTLILKKKKQTLFGRLIGVFKKDKITLDVDIEITDLSLPSSILDVDLGKPSGFIPMDDSSSLSISDIIDVAVDIAIDVATDAIEDMVEDVGISIDANITIAADGAEELATDIAEVVADIAETVAETIEETAVDISIDASLSIDIAADGIVETLEDIEEALHDVKLGSEAVEDSVAETIDDAGELFENIGEVIVDAAETVSDVAEYGIDVDIDIKIDKKEIE